MKDKTCPLLAIGIFAKVSTTNNYDDFSPYLPKCLKEDCEMWIEAWSERRKGHCGLRSK